MHSSDRLIKRIIHLPTLIGVIILAATLTACQESPPNLVQLPPSPTLPPLQNSELSTTEIITATNPPDLQPAPAIEVEPTATRTALPAPSPTPLPPITFGIPEEWMEKANAAIDILHQIDGSREWLIVSDGHTADIELLDEPGHLAVANEPIALAVPFTSDWEETTRENAEIILTEGHELVSIIPWREISPNHKALKIDNLRPSDAAYPLQKHWGLRISPGFKEPAGDLLKALQEVDDQVVHVIAVGDIMLDRSLGFAIEQGQLDYPFDKVAYILDEANNTVGNLESALGDTGQPAPKRYRFRAPVLAAESLALAGFDILSLANNHALDFGAEGLLQGIQLLNAQGIKTVGAGENDAQARQPQIIEANGLEIAFLSYVDVPVEASTGFDTASWTATAGSPGLAWADPQHIAADVRAAAQESDLVIVLLHSGFEYVSAPSEPQVTVAKAAIDAGAKLVIGHHAHILQGIEYYGDGVIIYGTGNFAFEIDEDPQTALFHIWLDRNGVRQIELQPAIVQFGGQPRLANGEESAAIRGQVYTLTDILNAQ